MVLPFFGLVAASLLFAFRAGAQPPHETRFELGGRAVSLEWQAPPECPSRAMVLERAARLVGGSAAPSNATDVAVQARAERLEGGEWQLVFDSSGGAAPERRVLGNTCEEIADAAALLIALLIDPRIASQGSPATAVPGDAALARPPPEAPRELPSADALPRAHDSEPAASTEKALASPPAGPQVARWHPSLELALQFTVLGGRLPHVAPGGTAAAGVRFRALRLVARLSYFPEQSVEAPGGGGAVKVWLGSAGVLAAYRALRGPVELAPFLAADCGWMHGRRSADSAASGSVALLDMGLGLLSNYPISGRFFAQASVEARFLVARPGFTVGSEEVHRPNTAGVALGLGALWVTDSAR